MVTIAPSCLVDLIRKIDAHLHKAVRLGCYNGNLKLLSELLQYTDIELYKSMKHSIHCIHQLLPVKTFPMKLCPSHCVFSLPHCQYELYKRSFVLRILFCEAQ